jgi:hypothetical protein
VLRVQKTLEDANIKLDSVLTDLMGKSGPAIIEALIAGETNPAKLASLADRRVKASPEELRETLPRRRDNVLWTLSEKAFCVEQHPISSSYICGFRYASGQYDLPFRDCRPRSGVVEVVGVQT